MPAAWAMAAVAAYGAYSSIEGNKQTNQTNLDIANAQNAFNAEQYAKRYQTTVQDLKAADLNPMLAYGQGAGSPASAVGLPAQTNPYQNLTSDLSKAVGAANVAMQTQLTDAQVTESISRAGVNDETRKNLSADTALKILEQPNVSQKTKNLVSEELLNIARKTATSAGEAATRLDTHIRSIGDIPEAVNKGKYHKESPYNPNYIHDISKGLTSAVNAKQLIGR